MEVGTSIWVLYDEEWARTCMIDRKENEVQVEIGGETIWISKSHVKPCNDEQESVCDLAKLVHLHEPSILFTLHDRFTRSCIYTSTGHILVAINPFRSIPELYTIENKAIYKQAGQLKRTGDTQKTSINVAPHAYNVADRAYNAMFALSAQNQTILVSGESGAGKTETTKIVMDYLAYVSDASNSNICERVLESNPILEAFGNATTLRNGNSSRFGKFIRIGFAATGELLGASITSYLLERTRLVSQVEGESNFHFFYQICNGVQGADREYFGLDVESFDYLKHKQKAQHFMHTATQFEHTKTAMMTLGMTNEEIHDIIRLAVGILHLGNLAFLPSGEESTHIQTSIDKVSQLLGVQGKDLNQNLCHRRIKAGAEYVVVGLSMEQAQRTRDAMAKTIYDCLFSWLVKRINESITYGTTKNTKFIGVVDIFGFEIFKTNGLEQLCINYANEKLQQLFEHFVFTMEQKEYENEGIQWDRVEYDGNQSCLEMIEARQKGLFAVLDEQCIMPRGNSGVFASRMYENHRNATKLQKAKGVFVVKHYAGEVCYQSHGFCEKNKDQLHKDAMALMAKSSNPFIKNLFAKQLAALSTPKSARGSFVVSSSVVSQFRIQLTLLLDVIKSTKPHFIRCIKPNDSTSFDQFTQKRVEEQLRCGGVFEAVRISRAGYPVRYPHLTFVLRYQFLHPTKQWNPKVDPIDTLIDRVKVLAEGIEALLADASTFRIGSSKMFLTTELHDTLEAYRARRERRSIIRIQSMYRRYRCRSRFVQQKAAAIVLETAGRRYLAKKKVHTFYQAVLVIQQRYRQRQRLRRVVKNVILIQCFVRRVWAMRELWNRQILRDELRQQQIKKAQQKNRETEYCIRWETGLLGIYFETDAHTGKPLVRRVHETLSTCTDIYKIHLGDTLVQVGSQPITGTKTVSQVLEQLQLVEKPVILRFRRADAHESVRSDASTASMSSLSDIMPTCEVIWAPDVPLGLGLEPHPDTGLPCVVRHTGNPLLIGMHDVYMGDVLTRINDDRLETLDFESAIEILETNPRPLILRFQRTDQSREANMPGEDDDQYDRMSSMKFNPKLDGILYHLTWHNDDGPLGIVVKQALTSYYPTVTRIKDISINSKGANQVSIGDILLCINNHNISKIGFRGAMKILQQGPKPLLLTFQRSS